MQVLTFDCVEAFASTRNKEIDFAFLKENGELLSIARSENMLVDPRAWALLQPFYDQVENLVELYPQYFRFFMALTLDLEDLGLGGDVGEKISAYVRKHRLAFFDTSNLRQLETLSLLSRRGELSGDEKNLLSKVLAQLREFVEQPEWYEHLNRPLFYELTHVVFLMGQFFPEKISQFTELKKCILNAGVLSLLDDDLDLLAELAICLDMINETVPRHWQMRLNAYYPNVRVSYDTAFKSRLNGTVDEYHLYLVLNWQRMRSGLPAFSERFEGRRPNFVVSSSNSQSLLSKLSALSHFKKIGNAYKTESGPIVEAIDKIEFDYLIEIKRESPEINKLMDAFLTLAS